jgi:hypothetical protein
MMHDLRHSRTAELPLGPAPPRNGVGGKTGKHGFALALAWLLALTGLAGQPVGERAPMVVPSPIDLPVPMATRPPLVDGHGLDEAWQSQPWTLLGESLRAKACTDGARIFLLVRFPAAEERRRHRPWRWDATAQQYLSGNDEEQALTVLWAAEGGGADIWIWRSDRTDASGHADDGWFMPGAGFLPDAGTPCWESRYVAEFAGAELPRFYPREPTGSLADVRARGVWEEGHWTVELTRTLATGQADDVALSGPGVIRLQLFPGLPSAVPEPGREWLHLRLPESPERGQGEAD